MEIPPTECFDKVLCASDDENPDVKKKMYNWWRAFFEVLGKIVGNMPKIKSAEFTEKMDALMAEIMKSGDKEASGGNEVVLEDGYDEADKADEDDMLKDFDFAVQHIGEIANKVKDIVNFINPYCESIGGTSKMNEDEVREFVKSIGFRPDSDGIDYETQLVDALTGKDTSYNAGWGAVYYNSDKVLQYLKKYGMLGSRGIKQKEAISKLKRLFKSGKWRQPEQQELDLHNEVDNTMTKTNERGGSDWVSMDDIVGMEVGEADDGSEFWKAVDDVDDLEKKGYWSGKFQVGDKVTWIDPDGDEIKPGYEVVSAPEPDDDGEIPEDGIYVIANDDGSEAEVLGCELRPSDADVDGAPDMYSDDEETFKDVYSESDWDGKSITRTLNLTKYEAEDLMDYIAEEIAHLEGEYSGLNIMGIVPKRILEYIEMKGLASSVKKLNPREVVVKWVVGNNDEDEFATAREMSKSVYDIVKDIYEGNFEYNESNVELEGSEDEQKPDEVKDGEKKYKQDGETKTLVTGSDKENNTNDKQEVTEMTIEQEITDPWKLLDMLWGQGRENLRELLESELFDDGFVMQMIEELEIHNLTSLNDAFAYDFETILDMFGCDVDAYRDNLEIKKIGDDSEEEED